MENVKVISVIGAEKGDYPYFLSKIFAEKKCRVLVIDNSCVHDLFLSLKRTEKDSDFVERGRSVFMRNKYVEIDDAGAFEKFDIVIIYHGLNVDYDMLTISDAVVMQTDYLPVTLRYIREHIDMEMVNSISRDNFFLIYRDKAGIKVTEQYLKKYMGLKGVENEAFISYDEGDYNAYLSFCYNGYQELKGLSSEFKAALILIRTFLFGKSGNIKKQKGAGKV